MKILGLSRKWFGHISAKGSRIAVTFVAVGMLATFLAPLSSVSAAAKGNCTSANGVKIKNNPNVCKGLAFYRGQTVTFVEPGSIGGAFDVQALAEIPGLAAFLGATVNEVRMITGASLPGQNYLASASPNGLTIGLLNPLNDAVLALTGGPGLNFNPAREAYLAGGGPSEATLVATKNSGVTTFAQFIATAKAGTAKNITEPTGTTVTIFRTLMAAVGGITNVNSPEWITGFGSNNQEIAGLEASDGTSTFLPITSLCSLIQGDQVVALMTAIVPAPGSPCRAYMATVPTIAQLAKKYGTTPRARALMSVLHTLLGLSALPTATQTGVAGYKIAALRAALEWDYKQPALKSAMISSDIDPVYQSPLLAKADYLAAKGDLASIACYLVSNGTCSKRI